MRIILVVLFGLSLFCQAADDAMPEPQIDLGLGVKLYEPKDGKLYVQSEPTGAEILVEQDGELRSTGKRTPAMVNPAKGDASLTLRKDGFKDATLAVKVGDDIVKTEKIPLVRATRRVDVVYEHGDDWQVFVDGKAANDVGNKLAKTPCTIEIPIGAKVVQLVKEGFQDMESTTDQFTFNKVPIKGQSRLLAQAPAQTVKKPVVPTHGVPNKFDPTNWSVLCWNGSIWAKNPINKMNVVPELGSTAIQNTTGVHVVALMCFTRETYKGDFECHSIFDLDEEASLNLIAASGADASVYVNIPNGKNINLIFKRTNSTFEAKADGRALEIKTFKANHSLHGRVGFMLKNEQKLLLKSFQITGK